MKTRKKSLTFFLIASLTPLALHAQGDSADIYRQLAEELGTASTPTAATSTDNETVAPNSGTFDQLVVDIQRDTERLWGKEVGHPIRPIVLDKPALKDLLDKLLQAELEKPEVAGSAELLRFFEMIPQDASLDLIYQELLLGQIAGLYNPANQSLYVISTFDPEGFLGNIILSHEIGHAIQDVHYDLANFLENEKVLDFQKAKQALIEGDATVLMSEWAAENFSPAAILSLTSSITSQMADLDGTPPVIVQDLIFSYMAGAEFCTQAMTTMGPGWRFKLFEDPPVSTEQILHPEKYLNTPRDLPVEVSLGSLPEGSPYSELYRNRYGEWATRLFLVTPGNFPKVGALTFDPIVKEPRAVAGAAGWGGDELVLLSRDGERGDVLIWRSVWDTKADAKEFEQAALYRLATFKRLKGARGTEFGFGNENLSVYHKVEGKTVDFVIAVDQESFELGLGLLEE